MSNRISCLCLILLALFPGARAADLDEIGTVQFATTAPAAAQQHFLTALAYLHSFAWKQARDEFKQAQQLAPRFAMAYWGESLTCNHPLLTEKDTRSPVAALNRLAATASQRQALAPTALEKGFMAAAEAYAFTSGDAMARRRADLQAMGELHNRFPGNDEVQAFYALALLSVAAATDDRESAQLRSEAGALALQVFEQAVAIADAAVGFPEWLNPLKPPHELFGEARTHLAIYKETVYGTTHQD